MEEAPGGETLVKAGRGRAERSLPCAHPAVGGSHGDLDPSHRLASLRSRHDGFQRRLGRFSRVVLSEVGC